MKKLTMLLAVMMLLTSAVPAMAGDKPKKGTPAVSPGASRKELFENGA